MLSTKPFDPVITVASSLPVMPVFLATSLIPLPTSATCEEFIFSWRFISENVSPKAPASIPSCSSVLSWATAIFCAVLASLMPFLRLSKYNFWNSSRVFPVMADVLPMASNDSVRALLPLVAPFIS